MNTTRSALPVVARVMLVAFAALAAGCAGVSTAPAPSAAVRSELAPTGTLRVAVFTGNPVIGAKDKTTGVLTGTTVELGRELSRQSGLPVTFVEYTAVGKMVDDAKSGTWDMAVVAYDPARLSVIDFAPPHITVDLTYLVAPGSTIRSVGEVDQPGIKVATARGAATALYLERTLKQGTVVAADNEPAAFALIKDDKVQAYAQNRSMLIGLAQGVPGARVLDDRFAIAEMCIVMPKGRPGAYAYVSAFVDDARKSGVVSRSIEAAGLRGVAVAAAKP